jgi:SAM-dependent methyltransferase
VVLDAGCGPGIDAAHMAQDGAPWVVAIDPSEGGVTQTRARTRDDPNVYAIRGCLESLPFADEAFDFVFCYGVLHHLAHPESGFRELVRTLKPRGVIALYVYEDFQTHTALERFVLRLVARVRRLTVRCPPRRLYRLCQVAAPLVYLGFSVPARLLARMPITRPLSQHIPFRHARSPRGLVGDLYDRFAAPLESRYSEGEVRRWFTEAELEDLHIVARRGWVAYASKG